MKKGFTLIELLAVIIILAVIALIATPLVLDVVDSARSEARKNSIYGYAEAVKLGVYEHQFKNNGANPTIDEDWLDANVVTKGDTVDCEKVIFHETKGVLLSGCTVGSDDTLYYYDGNNALTEEPTDFDDYFTSTPPTPSVTYKCKRADAGTLHTETCTRTSNGCFAAGYVSGTDKGTTIEYGVIKELGTDLESGDALNCDVNGDNIFDPVTERFYYVSSLYDTTTKTFNDEYAVLIYYTHTLNGVASTQGTAYETSGLNGENWHGPVAAATHLPTVESWTNVSLKSTTRQILNEQDGNTTGNGANTLGTFSYTKADGTAYAARLLTYKELVTACGNGRPSSTGYLDSKCEYMSENTRYSSSSALTDGEWLETPYSFNELLVWHTTGDSRYVTNSIAYNNAIGVRPAIEVLKTEILH